MPEENPIAKLFGDLLKDDIEKKMMNLIVDGKEADDIIEILLKGKLQDKRT